MEGFNRRSFEEGLRSLREETERIARRPPRDLTYTLFVLEFIFWVAVVPFLLGGVCAFLLDRA